MPLGDTSDEIDPALRNQLIAGKRRAAAGTRVVIGRRRYWFWRDRVPPHR